MSGVRRSWIAGHDFVMLHMDLVDALGGSYEAAALLSRIQYRAGADGWWVATKAEMCADIRLSEWKLDRALRELRDAGMVESERVNRFEPTLRWRLVFEEEESSVTRTGDHAVTRPPEEESSLSEKDESSFSSSKNVRTSTSVVVEDTSGPEPITPDHHDRATLPENWAPRREFRSYLRANYPDVNITESLRRFTLWCIAATPSKYSRSWEASFETWVSGDQRRIREQQDGGTDDLGVPYAQRRSVERLLQPGDEGYVDPQDLIDEALEMARQRPPRTE